MPSLDLRNDLFELREQHDVCRNTRPFGGIEHLFAGHLLHAAVTQAKVTSLLVQACLRPSETSAAGAISHIGVGRGETNETSACTRFTIATFLAGISTHSSAVNTAIKIPIAREEGTGISFRCACANEIGAVGVTELACNLVCSLAGVESEVGICTPV